MPRSKALRWFVRMIWLCVVVFGYRFLVDIGPQESSDRTGHKIVMFVIYAAGDGLLEWRWPLYAGPHDERDAAVDDASRRT